MTSQEKCLLLGFGDIARRLAQQLPDTYAITGARRSPDSQVGVDMRQVDTSHFQGMTALLGEGFNVIVITMTPSEMSDAGYQRAYVDTVKNVLAALDVQGLNAQGCTPRLIVFVSSSGVYGQQGGEGVDESSDTQPSTYSGQRLLEAESLLLNSDYPACCVRFSGIYGPGRRRLIDQVLAGHGAAKEPVLFSNRIHSDDCAGILSFLIEKQKTGSLEPVYLASDCEPTPLYDVKVWLAQQLHVSEDELEPAPVTRMLRSSKRCNNQRLLDSGYEFICPTFKDGYKTLLAELKSNGEL